MAAEHSRDVPCGAPDGHACGAVEVISVSQPALGGSENDDAMGVVPTNGGCYAWVIDGGTSVASQNYLGAAQGDVKWYVEALSAAMKDHAAQGISPRLVHGRAVAEVAAAYQRAFDPGQGLVPTFAQPIAAVTILRIDLAVDLPRCEVFQLADCPAFLAKKDGEVLRLTEPLGRGAEALARRRVEDAQRRRPVEPSEMFRINLEWLRRRREHQIGCRPLEISTPSHDAAFGGHEVTFALRQAVAIVIMSDGFERYATHYGLGDDTGMVAAVLRSGPDTVLCDIRNVERADARCLCFPRLKPSDDASCVVLNLGAVTA